MPHMNFDLEDGLPPVSFTLREADADRFMKFMSECSDAINASKAPAASQQPVPALLASIEKILDGIDRDDLRDNTGWWETSAGTEFGRAKLEELRALFRQPVPALSASIDSAEFDALLDLYTGSDHSDYKQTRAALVAHIDAHAAQLVQQRATLSQDDIDRIDAKLSGALCCMNFGGSREFVKEARAILAAGIAA